MANVMTPDTIRCANLAHAAPLYDEPSPLDYTCLSLYLLWLVAILWAVLTEWRRRTRESLNVWILWLPFLAGIVPSIFAIRSASLEPGHIEFYTQSQATRDFIEMCSNPLTQEFSSLHAAQTFFTECNTVQNRMDADIGGVGLRISLYISLVVIVFLSLVGHFHQGKTAVKEICIAQLACEYHYPLDLIITHIFA
jgi:hypothetical protein